MGDVKAERRHRESALAAAWACDAPLYPDGKAWAETGDPSHCCDLLESVAIALAEAEQRGYERGAREAAAREAAAREADTLVRLLTE